MWAPAGSERERKRDGRLGWAGAGCLGRGKRKRGESWAGLEREGVRGKVLFVFFQFKHHFNKSN